MKRPAEDGEMRVVTVGSHNSAANSGSESVSSQQPIAPTTDGTAADRIAILDCGAQYGKVIDRRVRELCVGSDILPLSTTSAHLIAQQYKAIIISGGPKSVYNADAPLFQPEIFHSGLPILGICYGFQLINKYFSGTVERREGREDGQYEVSIDPSSPLFQGLSDKEIVMLTHGDTVTKVGTGFKVIAKSGDIIAGVANEDEKIYGVQFHPEVDLTPQGKAILHNFLFNIAGCRSNFTIESRELSCIDYIRKTVKDKKVLVFVSGGVDSTVCAALLYKALNQNQVTAIHVDNGFMRKNETKQVKESLKAVGLFLQVYSKSLNFYNSSTELVDSTGEVFQTEPLCRTTEPEIKRKIIGDTFMKVFNEAVEKLNLKVDEVFLAQGTLRPDLIESANASASQHADAIKTHHNDTDLVRELRRKGRVVEPLCDFHKDEVRKLGLDLGLPESIVRRHPFPGPGLAIRIICATEPYFEKDFMFTQQIIQILVQWCKHKAVESQIVAHIKRSLSPDELIEVIRITDFLEVHQHSIEATLLPIKSVGVQGDCRTYSYVVALSTDQRPIPWHPLFLFAKLIPRICHHVNRVVYVFGPPVMHNVTEITPTHLTQNIISLVQEVDFCATDQLFKSGHTEDISQMPVILVPVHFDRLPGSASVQWSVCLRTFISNDFMTGIPAIPGIHLPEHVVAAMVKAVESVPMISRVMYDLTAKPPGTTEWE